MLSNRISANSAVGGAGSVTSNEASAISAQAASAINVVSNAVSALEVRVSSLSGVVAGTAHEFAFSNGQLTSGKLTVSHGHDLTAGYGVLVQIINNSNQMVVPDNVQSYKNSCFTVDLSSYGSITSTWYVVYVHK
jgi:hypothetical protein